MGEINGYIFAGIFEGKEPVGGLGSNGRIILKRILSKYDKYV
jgi:hypothetical protein